LGKNPGIAEVTKPSSEISINPQPLLFSMIYDPTTASNLKPWLVRTLEPMYAHLVNFFCGGRQLMSSI